MSPNTQLVDNKRRKIIHVDMDCFYAAIEIRDNPALANLPVAVGGSHDKRGVLCTCNYIARKFGLHSAMPTVTALRICPELVVLPVNFAKYKQVSRQIHEIFCRYSDLVEPLALDEAYLEVTNSHQEHGSATLIAQKIRHEIWQELQLTASAGVAPNKFLAKIASGWNKPNGLFVITPDKIASFIAELPVSKLFGVGKVTAEKLHKFNIHNCSDLHKYEHLELVQRFGKLGNMLYYQSHGIDNRLVIPNRPRKSLSVERTFASNILTSTELEQELIKVYHELCSRLTTAKINRPIKSQFIKIKFADFKQVTREIASSNCEIDIFSQLFSNLLIQHEFAPVRLIGIGVSFDNNDQDIGLIQLELFG